MLTKAKRAYMRKYYRNKYKNDPAFRSKVKVYQQKYMSTLKGKKARARRNKTFDKIHPNYYKDYCKKRRDNAKKNGFCIACLKKRDRDGSLCKACLLDQTLRRLKNKR